MTSIATLSRCGVSWVVDIENRVTGIMAASATLAIINDGNGGLGGVGIHNVRRVFCRHYRPNG